MKQIKFKLTGISPILINRFKEQDEIPSTMKKSNRKDYGSPRDQATATAYADPDGSLWIPSSWVKGCLSCVASDYKLPGSRKSVKSIVGGAVIPVEEKLFFVEGYKLKDIEVDSRPVVIQRSRIMRHRARLEAWTIECEVQLENDILPEKDLHEMLTDAGRRAGLGDFRPQKGGPFGRFQIVSWEVS